MCYGCHGNQPFLPKSGLVGEVENPGPGRAGVLSRSGCFAPTSRLRGEFRQRDVERLLSVPGAAVAFGRVELAARINAGTGFAGAPVVVVKELETPRPDRSRVLSEGQSVVMSVY